MTTRLEEQITRWTTAEDATVPAAEQLMPPGMAEELGVPAPTVRVAVPLRAVSHRKRIRGWMVGLATAVAILTVAVPVVLLTLGGERAPVPADSTIGPTTAAPSSVAPTTAAPTTAAPGPAVETGTLSARLQVAGRPLAGVQVFLGTNPGAGTDDPRFTCTDDAGDFSFDDVPLATPLIMITGPSDGGCANPKFVDPSADPPYPMVHQTLFASGSRIEADTNLGVFQVGRLPDDDPAIVEQARSLLEACYDLGDGEAARLGVAAIHDLTDRGEADGTISEASVSTLRWYLQNLDFQFAEGTHPACPTK